MSKRLIKGEILDNEVLRVYSKDCAIEDLRTSEIFVTLGEYLNRLFKSIGYKNRSVVNILDEYADIKINKIEGSSDQVFVDRSTSSCFVSTAEDVNKVNRLFDELCSKYGEDSVKVCCHDNCHYWDQITIKLSDFASSVVYVDLCDRYVKVIFVVRDNGNLIENICDEVKFKIEEDDFVDNVLLTVDAFPKTSSDLVLEERFKLSLNETVDLLILLGILTKKRRKVYLTELFENEFQEDESLSFISDSVDSYNYLSPLSRRVNFDNSLDFSAIKKLVTKSVDSEFIRPWDLVKFFKEINLEDTDYFQLNY